MKTRNFFPTMILVILLMNISTLFAGCALIGERGNGHIKSEDRSLPTFNSIEVSGAYEILITQGTPQKVTVEADENLLSLIKTEVKGDELSIYDKEPMHSSRSLKIYITVADLKKIDISGSCDLKSQGKITTEDLVLEISGSADTHLDLDVKRLGVGCSGSSKMNFSGTALKSQMSVSGASDIYAFDLATETTSVEISGVGHVDVNVSKEINAEVSGAASIRYKGSPEKVNQSVSGSGSIKKAE
jgi:hypothetical protein